MKEDLLIPVLDGLAPEDLCLGTTTLKQLRETFNSSDVEIGRDLKVTVRFRVRILLQPQATIFARKKDEWSHVVGVLVDGCSDTMTRGDLADRTIDICANVWKANGIARQLKRFHIGILATDVTVSGDVWDNYAHELKTRTEAIFKFDIWPQTARSAEVFVSSMKLFETQVAYSTLTEL